MNDQFTRQEKKHLEVLKLRLEYTKIPNEKRRNESDYIAGETNALAWIINLVESTTDPIHIRVEKLQRQVREIFNRLGVVEKWIHDEEDIA